MVFLWSDILIFLLLAAGAVWFYFAIKREYWKDAIHRILSNKMAILSFWILCFYLTIALLDSVHFRNSNNGNRGGQIISLLDHISKPLIQNTEKTYSAPFALYSYSKVAMFEKDGSKYRDYPRLKNAGKGIKNDTQKYLDIFFKIIKGVLEGVVIGLFLLGLYLLLIKSMKGKDNAPGGVFLEKLKKYGIKGTLAISIIFMILFSLIHLSTSYHILGTDKVGFDVFYSSLKGARTGIIIGTLTTLIVTPFAIFLGILGGYFGGWLDDVIQYVYTTLSSIPDILLIAAAMLIFQVGISMEETVISADKRLLYLCVIMGITSWTGLCRLIRAETLKLRELEFVEAAKALGISKWKIMFRHLVPNTMHIVLITVILRFSGLVLAEAVLSYIGIGVDPSMQSWGNMINQARLELARDPVVWWNLFASFAFMLGLVLPANIFGDAVRDALDPKLKGM